MSILIYHLRRGVDTNEPPDKTDKIMSDAANEIERLNGEIHSMGAHITHLRRMNDELRKIRDAARTLTEECEGGRLSPSLGTLAKLEDALNAVWHAATTWQRSQPDKPL